jgi:hypothetical protein
MNSQNHILITNQALGPSFSPAALQVIVDASLNQDTWRGQIGHPEYHFDDSAFEQGMRYIDRQNALISAALGGSPTPDQVRGAREAFGRLVHAAQDFYSHSNYVDLWLAQNGGAQKCRLEDIEPLEPAILQHPGLRSGRGTLLEVLTFALPFLKPAVMPLLGPDTHARMNLDHPGRGPLFPFAFEAARKRTIVEYDQLAGRLSKAVLPAFTGQPSAG